MSDNFEHDEYINVVGVVAWDSEERELKSGDTIRTFTIETIPFDTKLKVTLWPELAHANVSKGDFVAIRGKYTLAEVDGEVYQNLSASTLAVTESIERIEKDDTAGVI